MHLRKEYLFTYNTSKEVMKKYLTLIEIELDKLLVIKKLTTVDDCNLFLNNTFNAAFINIEFNTNLVISELNNLQTFCYDDISKTIPHISELKDLPQHEAFLKAKDINWLIKCIDDSNINEHDKDVLLQISEFNKKIRYFIHTTLAIAENSLPYSTKKKLERNISKKEMIISPLDMCKDIAYCLSEVHRIKNLIEQFHILSNVDYGNWNSQRINVSDIYNYINLYKSRFESIFFNENLFEIELEVIQNCQNIQLEVPLDKVKEVIDVLLHNAKEELIEKELSNGPFDKKIKCTLSNENSKLSILVEDNGRGIVSDNIDLPFVSTKLFKKNNHGIGLDIARNISIILSGNIDKYNIEPSGAAFNFTFPIICKIELSNFGHKINILAIGNASNVLKQCDEVQAKYKLSRVFNIKSHEEYNEFIKTNALSSIDIVIKTKHESYASDIINNVNFKAELIEV